MSVQERTRLSERPRPRSRISERRRDAIGVGVALLNRLAGSRAIDRLGLRKQTERVVFEATKTGFRTAGALTRR
jgi:hypothetical protein